MKSTPFDTLILPMSTVISLHFSKSATITKCYRNIFTRHLDDERYIYDEPKSLNFYIINENYFI